MNQDTFWEIIDQLQHFDYSHIKKSSDRKKHQLKELKGLLKNLSLDEILDFEKCLSNAFIQATKQSLVTAAEIVLEGISYDTFDYFLYWLIFQGKEVYQSILQNPDNLISIMETRGYPQFEEIGSVASDLYHEKTGEDVPVLFDEQTLKEARARAFVPMPKELAKQLFPKLISEFGNSFE